VPKRTRKYELKTNIVPLVEFETPIPGIECDHTAFRELAKQKKYGNPHSLE
jgi:hypothetical protein